MNKRIVGILAVLVLLSVVVAWQMQPESFGGLIPGLEYSTVPGTCIVEKGQAYEVTDPTNYMPGSDEYTKVEVLAVYFIPEEKIDLAKTALESFTGGEGKILTTRTSPAYNADLKIFKEQAGIPQVLHSNLQYTGQDLSKEVLPPTNLIDNFRTYYAVILVVLWKDGGFLASDYWQSYALVQRIMVVTDTYCDTSLTDRGSNYCYSNFEKYYCDQAAHACKDPCAGCGSSTEKCLAEYARSADDLKELLAVSSRLCVASDQVCDYSEDCKPWVERVYNVDLNSLSSNVDELSEDLEGFGYGAHCEKINPTDPKIKAVNSFVQAGLIGQCMPKAEEYDDCQNIFGSPQKFNYVASDGSFARAGGWAIDNLGRCVLDECASSGDCVTSVHPSVNDWTCIPVNAKDSTVKPYVGAYGVEWAGTCTYTKLDTDLCNKNSDCKCGDNYNGICKPMITQSGDLGRCSCVPIPPPTQNCKIHDDALSDNAWCMFEGSASLGFCKKYECQGNMVTASCNEVEAKCTTDEDCYVDTFEFGTCSNGCCAYGAVPPPPPPTPETICNDGKDNDGDTFIDCDDPDCKGTEECILGGSYWEGWMFPATVALLMFVVSFGAAYATIKRKDKAVIAMIVAAIVAVITYLIVDSLALSIGNPFDVFTPKVTQCGSLLGMTDPFCQIGNAFETVKWLGSLLIAGLVSLLSFRYLKNISSIGDNKILLLGIIAVIFVSMYIITAALFWFALIAAIIVGMIQGLLPIPQRVSTAEGTRIRFKRR